MDIREFSEHFNLTAEQRDFVIKYGYNEVADRLNDVPGSLNESSIRREADKLHSKLDVENLLAAADEIINDRYSLAFYNFTCYYWWERQETMLYGNKLPLWEQRPVTADRVGIYNLLAALAGFQAVERSYAQLGLPPEVAQDTIQYITGAVQEYAAGHDGKCGVGWNKLQWMRFYVDGKLFRIGRFEYMVQDPMNYLPAAYRRNSDGRVVALCREGWKLTREGLIPYNSDPASAVYKVAHIRRQDNTVSGIPLNPAGFAEVDREITLDLTEYSPVWSNWDLVPGIHIPGGGKMTPEACRESLQKAVKFFKRYFKREVAGFSCFSWIFNTQFEEVLPESNLAEFMRQLYLVPFTPVGVEGLAFVFGKSTSGDWSDYPRDNSLRRAFHQIRESGQRLRGGAMFVEARGIENFGQQIYRQDYKEF